MIAAGILDKPKKKKVVASNVRHTTKFSFEETTGEVVDSKGLSTGSVVGTATRGVSGKIGKAITLNGGYVATNYAAPTGNAARSFAIWFKTTKTASYQHIIEYGTSGTRTRFTLRLDLNNTLRFEIQGWGQNGTTVVTDGQWHLLVYTHDGSNTVAGSKVYLDNQLEISITNTTPINTGTDIPVAIGTDAVYNDTQLNREFIGSLDEFLGADVEWTEAERNEVWNEGNGIAA